MSKTDSEILESYKARIKRQNNAIKQKYDRVSATLPKGTINRINALGLSINGVINDSLLAYLDRLEWVQGDTARGTTTDPEKRLEKAAKSPDQERYEKEDLENLNAMIQRAQKENAARHEAERRSRQRKSLNEALAEAEG